MNILNKLRAQKEKGFTIIEVVLVLAIAGLIFLMVFIALPALQSSQRDTARNLEAGLLANLKKNGMQVTQLSESEMSILRDKMRPVTAKHGVTVGQDLVKELQAEIDKARTAAPAKKAK